MFSKKQKTKLRTEIYKMQNNQLWNLATINAICVLALNRNRTPWPEIDNLSGIRAVGTSEVNDFYSSSLLESARIFTIIIFKIVSFATQTSDLVAVSILGSAIMIFCLPLFYLAIQKCLVKNADLKSTKITLTIFTIVCIFLNSNIAHKFEVNGFYLNPFSMGATSANIAFLLLTLGFLSKKKFLGTTVILIALLIHITTAVFFTLVVIILKAPKLKKANKRNTIIYGTISLSLLGLICIVAARINLDGWNYYINKRANNHFVVTTEQLFRYQLVLYLTILILTSLYLCIGRINKKLIIIALVSLAIINSQTAYVNYSIPFLLAIGLIILSSHLEKRIILLLLSQQVLFVLQTSSIQLISTTSSMFIPGTRFSSILVLTLIMLLVIEQGRISTVVDNQLDVKRINTSGYQSALKLLILALVMAVSFNQSQNAYQTIQRTLEDQITFKVSKKVQYLPLGVDTVGLREFKNMNIYVDEYPFWADMTEYAQRSKFKNDLVASIEGFQFNKNRVNELKTQYGINSGIILFVTREYGIRFKLNDCEQYNWYYTCVLW
jgi:hypothetical protein